MDHHCPWTANCVSHFTFPHFVRFLLYAVAAMSYLEYFLYLRAAVLWNKRNLPSVSWLNGSADFGLIRPISKYLGPSAFQMAHLFLLGVLNSLTLFLVSITLFRMLWALGGNVTTIESWEIERHQQLLRRARVLGGYLDAPGGKRVRIVKQEFPYDIGIWRNIKQGMGTGNFLLWLWPFAKTPTTSGIEFEVNGFEDEDTLWPPPDPDRMLQYSRVTEAKEAFTYSHQRLTPEEEIQAFRKRQEDDLQFRKQGADFIRRKPFRDRFDLNESEAYPVARADVDQSGSESGEEGWKDDDGNRLKDFGVDEEVEFYDEDMPLAELMRLKQLNSTRLKTT